MSALALTLSAGLRDQQQQQPPPPPHQQKHQRQQQQQQAEQAPPPPHRPQSHPPQQGGDVLHRTAVAIRRAAPLTTDAATVPPAATEQPSLAAGERLWGGSDYQAVRELGRGASGAVYLARDVALHRTVAVKVLPAPHRASPEACERFRREARMAGQLSHPNIVPLYAFAETPDAMFLVMPYVDGGSLADRLRRERRLPAGEVRRVLADLALALDHAHRRGVVHRDVKPENVLLDRESGRAMLVDFGVATRRWWDVSPEEVRRAFGTPAFMSPEQALGEPTVDGRSDLYAIGVLGYAMLTGSVPFAGRDPFAVTARRLSGEARPLALVAPDAPRDLVAAIERCLARDPEARWTSALELYDALTGGAPQARRPRWESLLRPLRSAWAALLRVLPPVI